MAARTGAGAGAAQAGGKRAAEPLERGEGKRQTKLNTRYTETAPPSAAVNDLTEEEVRGIGWAVVRGGGSTFLSPPFEMRLL